MGEQDRQIHRRHGLITQTPFSELYVVAWFFCGLLHVPFWILYFLPRSRRPRRSWSLSWCLGVRFLRFISTRAFQAGWTLGRSVEVAVDPSSLKRSEFVWVPPADDRLIQGFVKQAADECGLRSIRLPGYWFVKGHQRVPAGTQIRETPYRAKPWELVALHLHGGAYVLGTAHESYVCTLVSRGLLEKSKIARTFAVDYRLAADAPFPAQLVDALSAYAYLVNDCGFDPSRIIVVGDSAGGNIALGFTRYLRDTKILPMPGGLLLLSPWCDPSFSFRQAHPEGSGYKNIESDILEDTLGPYAVACLRKGHDASILKHPYIAPCAWPLPDPVPQSPSDLFTGFPKTLAASGETERLRDEIRELVKRMQAGSVDVEYHEEPDAFHDIVVMPWGEPHRTRTLLKAADWIQRCFVD